MNAFHTAQSAALQAASLQTAPTALRGLSRARLPAWLLDALPGAWPRAGHQPALADIEWSEGRIRSVRPHDPASPTAADSGVHDVGGALVLPGLVDAHLHLDKTFTLERMGAVRPGLLGAIEAMMVDRRGWTPDDVRARASRALALAFEAGVVHARTHCDWWEADVVPVAWPVLRELAQEWAGRLTLQQACLVPLHLYADRDAAMRIAAVAAASGQGALLGGFVHTSNWNPQALENLLHAAQAHGLNVDLHVDEELNPAAQGLATIARLLREMRFEGHVTCGHVCALSAQDESQALATLDAVAQVPVTLVTLPITNLLLQDAQTGRTPRLRGITLVKEARERGIPLLVASDNVQDPFCAVGSYDPLEAFAAATTVAQLPQAFDAWSASLCRSDWLARGASPLPLSAGTRADLVVFHAADAWSFPSRSHARTVLRAGAIA